MKQEGIYDIGGHGTFWTSTQSPDKADGAGGITMTSDQIKWYHGFNRYYGHNVRPIVTE